MPSRDTSDTTRKSAGSSSAGTVSDDMKTLQNYGFGTMSGMGVAWAEMFSDMGSEVLTFMADRIKEDVRTQHRMLHCKDVGELHKIQSTFVQTAIDQYTAETGKLVQMSQDLIRRSEGDKPKGD